MSVRRSLRSTTRALTATHASTSSIGQDGSPPGLSKRKSQENSKVSETSKSQPAALLEPPSTPPSKRPRRNGPTGEASQETPIPATDGRDQILSERPAEPHRTNATLKTPGGTRLVPHSKEIVESSPVKGGIPQPTTTTGQLLEKACAHLIAVDPRLKPLIEKHHCRIFSPQGLAEELEPFESLCSGIMSQQVTGAAAKSIKNKFIALFNQNASRIDASESSVENFPKPSQVVPCTIPFLRTAGLSERKAEYIKGLAEKFDSGELSTKMLMKASDEEVLEKLVAVRGLGRWSVEMFACFGLKRLDVLSTGDLGVQRGMAAFIGKDVKKLRAKGGGKWKYLSEKEMLDLSAPFAPYRSVFMWYMWRVEDVDIDAFG